MRAPADVIGHAAQGRSNINNTMSNKNIRLSELKKVHPVGALDHRNFINDKGRFTLLDGVPRKERRRLAVEGKRLGKEYSQILERLSKSGPKFQADKVLREMAIEYTHRFASSGIYTQPTSFNYFESFLHIKLLKHVAPYAEIEKECSHLFCASDYFSYITSGQSDSFRPSSLLNIPQDLVYHFSTQGNVNDLSFLNGEDREFSIAGFSMIRRGNSLHWYLVGGEFFNADEWNLRKSDGFEMSISNTSRVKEKFLSESIKKRGSERGGPVALKGTETHLRTIVAGEFDLESERHLSRCYLAEYENCFDVVCDDPEVFFSVEKEEIRSKMLEAMKERFGRSAVLWSLAESLFQLPVYFNTRLALNKRDVNLLGHRIPGKKGGKGIGVEYTIIPALDAKSTLPSLTITKISLPQYEIEKEGHWRKISAKEVGMDRHGNPIAGRTWVAASSKWKQNHTASPVIFVKDTLTSAKLKIEEYIAASAKVDQKMRSLLLNESSEAGELYIMRCSAMKELIFKVGFTDVDSSERARQLSSATGVPLAFWVLKRWRHKEARKLEVEVHAMLAPYRINDSREFFLAEYSVIVRVIESVLERSHSAGWNN